MEKKSKEVKMNGGNGNGGKQPEKIPYEQLEQIAGQLNQQCRVLQQQLVQAQNTIAEFNEIGMLLGVLGKSEHFSSQFVERCSSKIEELITRAFDESEEHQEHEQN